jgi:hypothetical protein
MLWPAAAVAGTVSEYTIMSAPITIDQLPTLLLSEASGTSPGPSALARTNQYPVAEPAGMVSAVAPLLLAPAARAGTARLPSAMSAASSVLLLDRKNSVTDVGAVPAP